MKLILISTLLFLSCDLFAANKIFPVGKVVRMKGQVSVLQPHTLEAVNLKMNDFVYEDSSILSEKKSFAKILLTNGSSLIVGPESKIVINLVKEKEGTVLGLLKGALRAQVEKSKTGKKHFYIKTRTAAIGVRGTDFMTSFNFATKKTALLTYQGKVAIKKVDRKMILDNESTPEAKIKKVKEIEKILEEKPILATEGEFTNVDALSKEVAPTVKVNVKQFVRLKVDNSFGVEEVKLDEKIIKKMEEKVIKLQKKEQATLSKRGDNGFVDIQTGIYVPLNKKGKEVGTFATNGEYIPPKGMKLDARDGFVPLSGDHTKEYKEEDIEDLNKKIQDQIVKEAINPAYKRYFDID